MAEKINELEHTIGTVLPSHFKDLLMQIMSASLIKTIIRIRKQSLLLTIFLDFRKTKTMILSQHTTTMRAEYQRN